MAMELTSKSLVVAALQTAKAGSKGVPNKNTMEIDGKPLYLHNVLNALESCYIGDKVYVTTDDESIIKNASKYKYVPILRPNFLCGDSSSHHLTIKHGLLAIEKHYFTCNVNNKIDILVILLGNNRSAYTKDIDAGIKKLLENDYLDSCISVSKYNMFNPFRAYKINDDFMLETVVPQEVIKGQGSGDTNLRNAFGDSYFFNGSFWICRRQTIINNRGLLPFPWLGHYIGFIVQEEGVMEIDAPWQVDVIKEKEKHE
jgi:CMP-N,N'-diacetyllegionaminic acid synthase